MMNGGGFLNYGYLYILLCFNFYSEIIHGIRQMDSDSLIRLKWELQKRFTKTGDQYADACTWKTKNYIQTSIPTCYTATLIF